MQTLLLNGLVIAESLILLTVSLILFAKTKNLTKLKQYEEAFIKAQVEQQSKRVEFLPMLVHELRAPLSVIQGAADLLIKNSKSLTAEQIHTLLNQVKTSSANLLKIIGDILDVSKMEGGRFQISPSFAEINDLIKEECGYFESLTKMKNISLECKTDEHLPSFSFDPDRIRQVLNNLLSNAIKFTPQNGKILVVSKQVRDVVSIEVSDSGVGIVDEDKPLLFQRFFQASNQNGSTEKGTGLGLVIAKGIVEAHGGKIWVEDNKPQGAKFTFVLPLK